MDAHIHALPFDPARLNGLSETLVRSHHQNNYREVGQATALQLRGQGLTARYLRGGIDGWQATGRPLASKEMTS